MANFVRVIPNILWEELNDKGLLDSSFPNSKPSKFEDLLSKFPHSLQQRAEEFLQNNPSIDWNSEFEFIYQNKPIRFSNIVDLLVSYFTKSKHFSEAIGNKELESILNKTQENPTPKLNQQKVAEELTIPNKVVTRAKIIKDQKEGAKKKRGRKPLRKNVKKQKLTGGGWLSYERNYNGGNTKIRKETLPLSKDSGKLPGSEFFY